MIYCKRLFLSTPSARRATVGSLMTAVVGEKFLSTPSARRATRCECHGTVWRTISIHALREESDKLSTAIDANIKLFLSTPSARRATRPRRSACHHHTYFYPRPPRGERRDLAGLPVITTPISIHALREESDRTRRWDSITQNYFYPRPPRGERRRLAGAAGTGTSDFYPRPPRGERRRLAGAAGTGTSDFYPRPPRGERRSLCPPREQPIRISIHALREESDKIFE